MEVPFNRVESFEQVKNPGDGYWSGMTEDHPSPRRLQFQCPCGCGSLAGILVSGEHAWWWSGNLDKPTATPSILINGHGNGCGWHGYLTDGVFRSC